MRLCCALLFCIKVKKAEEWGVAHCCSTSKPAAEVVTVPNLYKRREPVRWQDGAGNQKYLQIEEMAQVLGATPPTSLGQDHPPHNREGK